MNLAEYFEKAKGLGVMATADNKGKVDMAVYSRPHVMEDNTLAFIMADRLTHLNLQSNPQAAFLFKEDGPGYQGKRLILTKIREEENSELLDSLRRRAYLTEREGAGESKFIVFFKVEQELPLIGSGN
ncbi:MAG: pyridoxamine 5'-phosphate oxidase family protein [Thermodesulfobacteriota bacterium]